MTDDDRPRGSCVIPDCSRDPYPREDGHIPLVCGPHVSQAEHMLREIPVLCADLAAKDAPESVAVHADVRERVLARGGTNAVTVELVEVEALTVASALPAAMTPGAARGGRVSGSAEPRLPVSINAVDLLSPRRSIRRAPSEDDAGFLPVASTLDFWVQDLRDHRARGEGLPEPSITVLACWLAERIGEAAADWYPIDEFFDQIRAGHGVLWAMCGYTKPQKEELLGVPCSSCDVRLLVRMPGSSYVECEACGHLLTEEEYAAWCKAMVAAARKSVTPQT